MWVVLRYFNSQPREGGWLYPTDTTSNLRAFQLTAARRRLANSRSQGYVVYPISTHSRAKAAGWCDHVCVYACEFQLTAARRRLAVGGVV